jgi:thiamine-phosphate pyrophosphorylase
MVSIALDTTARILDANANRAREGLRVMEDTARFGLDNAHLAAACKQARHDLQLALKALPVRDQDLLSSRDTPGDVGTMISSGTEHSRPDGLASIASAACKRVTEALRAIEEAAKIIAGNGSAVEQIRYRVYDIEKRLLLELSPPCPQWSLCVLITAELCTNHSPEEVIRRSAAGGADCIQLREKEMLEDECLEHAGRLVSLCKEVGVAVIMNDRVAIARLTDADGVHLGKGDLPTHEARVILGQGRWIGRTCSSHGSALQAIVDGADYCGIGPVFPSTTKAKPELAGIDLVRAYLADPMTASTPHLAISGITPHNIGSLSDAGCKGVAVSSAVCSSEDPEGVCRTLVERIAAPTLTV